MPCQQGVWGEGPGWYPTRSLQPSCGRKALEGSALDTVSLRERLLKPCLPRNSILLLSTVRDKKCGMIMWVGLVNVKQIIPRVVPLGFLFRRILGVGHFRSLLLTGDIPQ